MKHHSVETGHPFTDEGSPKLYTAVSYTKLEQRERQKPYIGQRSHYILLGSCLGLTGEGFRNNVTFNYEDFTWQETVERSDFKRNEKKGRHRKVDVMSRK